MIKRYGSPACLSAMGCAKLSCKDYAVKPNFVRKKYGYIFELKNRIYEDSSNNMVSDQNKKNGVTGRFFAT